MFQDQILICFPISQGVRLLVSSFCKVRLPQDPQGAPEVSGEVASDQVLRVIKQTWNKQVYNILQLISTRYQQCINNVSSMTINQHQQMTTWEEKMIGMLFRTWEVFRLPQTSSDITRVSQGCHQRSRIFVSTLWVRLRCSCVFVCLMDLDGFGWIWGTPGRPKLSENHKSFPEMWSLTDSPTYIHLP